MTLEAAVTFRAGLVQMRSGLDRARNLQSAAALIEEAAGRGAHFVATPEMTNALDRRPARLLVTLPDGEALEEIRAFADLAQRLGVFLLAGSFAVKVGPERAANRSLLFGPDGRILARYDKLHMFDVDLPNGESWRESRVYAPGDAATLVRTPIGAFGMSICYDVRFPSLYRRLAQAGAEVLLAPAAFTRQTGRAHWKVLLTARAIENGAYVLAPAQGGVHEDGRETFGHSLIIGPWGEILAEADHDEPGVILADIDLSAVARARASIPNLALERAFELLTIDL